MVKKLLSFISILIPTFLTILIVNFLFGIVPMDIQGLPFILPFILCPIGAALGLIGYKMNRDNLARAGMIFNIGLFLFPIAFNIVGTLSGGV
ncbi:hypothetical protein JF544_01985 [Halobacillus kuroshimensis]|uniref:Uncharacterized protein n=1 Tax=Halobacillus kuroshimensis TaxID=302481 RepID=A0ABS3DRR1_9BACI|nr:hypothetical protein [Halobacillus kuroshimensis]MBN8233991.1 hypothetical protein [Halobacillus kuroshimensis]